MKKALSDAFIRGIRPEHRRVQIVDLSCRGLMLRVTTSGAKTFSFRFRDPTARRRERITIGTYPDVSLRAARAKADDLRRLIATGKNPATHRRQREERLFAALADRYINEHARRFKRTSSKDERNLRLHVLPHWGTRDYTTIERRDVIVILERIVTAGKPTLANRVHSLISKVFSFALEADLLQINPCVRLRKRGAERVKTRTLTDPEIRLFWKGASDAPRGLALQLILLLACRPGEVAGMAHSELEIKEGRIVSWTIPAARAKNGRAHYLPLSLFASQLISKASNIAGDREYIFPSRNGRPLPNYTLSAIMNNLGKKFSDGAPGVESWRANQPTPHDLRRTAATRLGACGVPGEDISAILNHVRSDITGKHYNLYDRAAEKKRSLDRWALILSAILQPQGANVVPLAS